MGFYRRTALLLCLSYGLLVVLAQTVHIQNYESGCGNHKYAQPNDQYLGDFYFAIEQCQSINIDNTWYVNFEFNIDCPACYCTIYSGSNCDNQYNTGLTVNNGECTRTDGFGSLYIKCHKQ